MTAATDVPTPTSAAQALAHAPRRAGRTLLLAALVGAALSALLLLVPTGAETRGGIPSMQTLRLAIVIAAGIGASIIDLREHRIPDAITFPAACAIGASAFVESVALLAFGLLRSDDADRLSGGLLTACLPIGLTLLGAAALGGTLFALAWFGTLGLGDVKLGALLGAALLPPFGWPALVIAFTAAYLLALPHALILLIGGRRSRHGAASHGSTRERGSRAELPLGPYLVLGAALASTLCLTLALP